jgi:hypothetical protein
MKLAVDEGAVVFELSIFSVATLTGFDAVFPDTINVVDGCVVF